MNFLKRFMASSLLLALKGCAPTSPVEGVVLSSKDIGQGITEYLIQTNSVHMPYSILKANNNNLHKGSKVVLEFPPDSMGLISY